MTERLSSRASWGDSRDFADNAAMIRSRLCSGTVIEFACFNREERDATAALLTEEERKNVGFTWLDSWEQ